MLLVAVWSLLIIVLAHKILTFLRDTLTVPRVRDLAVRPSAERAKLQAMAAIASPTSKPAHLDTDAHISPDDATQMRNELRTFLSELKRDRSTPSRGKRA